jgi:hypothetical protein
MQPIGDDERVRVLRALLPDDDRPGDQVGWQLAVQPVGQAFVDDDARCAVVVNGRFAVVYGEARPAVGRFLYDRVFVGTLQGALAALDPVPCIDGVAGEFDTDAVRVFFETDTVRPSDDSDIAPLVCRRPAPADDAVLLRSEGAWVVEMWRRPSEATYLRGLYDSEGGVLGLAASYAVSPSYAEIAAWVDPMVAGHRLVASQAESFLGEVVAGGHRISSVILLSNRDARRFAEGAGWNPVGEQRVVMFAPPPAGSGRAWQRNQALGDAG